MQNYTCMCPCEPPDALKQVLLSVRGSEQLEEWCWDVVCTQEALEPTDGAELTDNVSLLFLKGVVCCLCVLWCQSNNFFLSNVIDEAAYVH